MGNQYSITVSAETHEILTILKDNGYKVSQMVDVAVKTLGTGPLIRLHALHRRSDAQLEGMDE
jgi:hypothetical protein